MGLNLSARDVLRSRAAVRLPRAKQSTVGVEDVNGFGLAGSLSFFGVNMYSLSATTLIGLKAKDKGSSIVVKKIWDRKTDVTDSGNRQASYRVSETRLQ